MDKFDVIVLGGGPAGFTAANRAAEKGASVAIFEGADFGGVCLNEGCIPSKSFLHSAASSLVDGNAFSNRVNAKNQAVNFLRGGVRGGLRKNKVKIVFSFGKIVSYDNGVTVVEDENGNAFSTENLIIATGSHVKIPNIAGLDKSLEEGSAFTTHELFDLPFDFEKITVIGGGVIGVEMASCFARAGKAVTLIEGASRLCSTLSHDCSDYVEKKLKNLAVTIYTSAKVLSMENAAVKFMVADETLNATADRILVCTGRAPSLTGFGLEKLNLDVSSGYIATDNRLKTSLKGIYAAGDVNGKSMLAHTAYREAEVCVNNIFGEDDFIDYALIPSVIYGDAELATVGLDETALKNLGVNGFYKKVPLTFSGRAVAEGCAELGFCKLIFDENEIIRGASLCGCYSSEIILALSVMISEGGSISRMKKYVYPHPTVGEIIRETLYSKNIPFEN